MKKIKIEVWKSNNNSEEIHLFEEEKTNTYILGFNPDIIGQEGLIRIFNYLNEIGYDNSNLVELINER